jgi:methionyl-tRNA formyltransferase
MTDLPYGRGGSPLQNLIEKGHSRTKISALKVTSGIDEGPIYFKKELSLLGTAEEIFIRANHIIRKMINEFVEGKLEPSDQQGEVTKFKRRTPQQGCLNNLSELDKVYDYIRMLDAEGYPPAYFQIDNFKLEFSRASLKANKSILADVRITKK